MEIKEINNFLFSMSKGKRKLWLISVVNDQLDEENNKEIVKHIIENYGDFYESRALRITRGEVSLADYVAEGNCFLIVNEEGGLTFILKEEDDEYADKEFDIFLEELNVMFGNSVDREEIKETILKQFIRWNTIYRNK